MSIARDARMLEATAITVWGPPAGRDGYRDRNVELLRNRIAEAKQDRNAARRAGDNRRAEVLQQVIEGWQQSLAGVLS